MNLESAKKMQHRPVGLRVGDGKIFIEVRDMETGMNTEKTIAQLFLVEVNAKRRPVGITTEPKLYETRVVLDGYATYPDLADAIAGFTTMALRADKHLADYLAAELEASKTYPGDTHI
jgi:hypothetical protein